VPSRWLAGACSQCGEPLLWNVGPAHKLVYPATAALASANPPATLVFVLIATLLGSPWCLQATTLQTTASANPVTCLTWQRTAMVRPPARFTWATG